MTLSFSTKWPKHMGDMAGQPNYFVEKIWEGLINNGICDDLAYDFHKVAHLHQFDDYWDGQPMDFPPKLHTIREDKNNRWKEGSSIHMVINNRTKDRFQFAPVVKCITVQTIEVKFHTEIRKYQTFMELMDGELVKADVTVDGKWLDGEEIERLAINDGFPSVEAFFQFFDKDFKGKIIHWTDLKY